MTVLKRMSVGVLLLTMLFVTTITVSGYVGRASDTTIMSAILTPLRRPGFSVETIYRLFDLDRTISLHGRLEDASEVRLSPDGRKALVLDGKAFGGEYRYAFYLYDLTTGERWLLYEQDVTAGLLSNHSWQAQAWSADGTQLAYFHPYERRFYEFNLTTETSRPLFDLAAEAVVSFISWSPDGRQIAIGTYEAIMLLSVDPADTYPVDVSHLPVSNGVSVVWSPDNHYIVAQSVSTSGSWFHVIESQTGHFALSDASVSGRYVGWSCDSNRIIYQHFVPEPIEEDSASVDKPPSTATSAITSATDGIMGVFLLDIAANSQTRISDTSQPDGRSPMNVYSQTLKYCDQFLILVTSLDNALFLKLMDLDLSVEFASAETNEADFHLSTIDERAQLVVLYQDGSIIYRIAAITANGKPIFHFFRHHGGVSRLLFSLDNPVPLQRWWNYRWFGDDSPGDPIYALAVEATGYSPTPIGRLIWLNIDDQSEYYLTTEDEIATEYTVWR